MFHENALSLTQFQLTVSVTAVGFAFVSSIASKDESSALTAVQLLWVNLIQDTLAALALATDPPTLELLDRKPEPKGTSLISFNMWKMIFGQSVVQLAVIFVFNFSGAKVFPSWNDETIKTMVFNTFVWLQIFNEINCRRLDNKINMFSGIQRNPFFMVIMVIMVACQTLIIFVGGAAFSVTPLNSHQWIICVGLGFLAIPTGTIVRLIPNDFVRLFIPQCILERRTDDVDDEERQIEDWDDAIEVIRDDLLYFKRLRGENGLEGIENHRSAIDGLESQSEVPTRRASFDGELPEINHLNGSSRKPSSRLYSVNSATTLVPGQVALSIALAPVTGSDRSLVTETREEGDSTSDDIQQTIPPIFLNSVQL
jgi:Cation transporting ATPase, C-terminus